MAAFKNIFNSIPLLKPKRNVFDLSFDNLVSLNFGDLVPIMCKEVLPGDTWQVQSSVLVRFAPMLAPIMHRVNVYVHYFFVPNRILWSNFEDFITGGRDGMANPSFPRLTFDEMWDEMGALAQTGRNLLTKHGSLLDYLGLPTLTDPSDDEDLWNGTYAGREINLLPFAAYQKIYNDYYRDQNLQDEIDVKDLVENTVVLASNVFESFGSAGPIDVSDPANLFMLRRRAWEKDYFTSALPWPQRGGDVHLPLSGDAPISYVHDGDGSAFDNATTIRRADNGQVVQAGGTYSLDYQEDGKTSGRLGEQTDGLVSIDNSNSLKVDMSDVTSATINELRRAVRLQEWLEKNARSGARYIEQILSHFGVRSSDGRLDRAEYLGGGKAPVQISEVLQTSETTNASPLGDFAGHGISVGNSNKFRKFFEEHGFVLGIMSIMPRSSYAGGLPRIFTKFDKFDYAWPEFANLGEQEIRLSEIDAAATAGRDEDGTYISGKSIFDPVFGYTPRYAEYKFSLNELHGDFLGNMRFWHLGRIFDAPEGDQVPRLNEDFVQVRSDDDNLKRIFAVEDVTQHHLWCEVYNRVTVKRALPKFGAPTL